MNATTLPLYRITTKTKVGNKIREYVDWYSSSRADLALELAIADGIEFGIPTDAARECVECNPETLKPITA